jgi:phosphoglycolate phosphatase
LIQCVVFDFDGTLVLSNAIKEDAFFAVAGEFPRGRAHMEGILKTQCGDRSAIWTRFAAEVGIAARAGQLVEKYTALCHARIQACSERAGASATVLALRQRGLRLCVNSSTPGAPLRRLVESRFPIGTFNGIYGGYGQKLENLRLLCDAALHDPSVVTMVGDGVDDAASAHAFGCHFVGVSGGSLAAADAGPLIEDLQDLLPLLDRMKGPVRS